MTAEELDEDFEYVRHCYRTLRRVGLLTEYEGDATEGSERKLDDETYRTHTTT